MKRIVNQTWTFLFSLRDWDLILSVHPFNIELIYKGTFRTVVSSWINRYHCFHLRKLIVFICSFTSAFWGFCNKKWRKMPEFNKFWKRKRMKVKVKVPLWIRNMQFINAGSLKITVNCPFKHLTCALYWVQILEEK